MEKSVFATRLDHCYNELKWLYCELYHNDMEAFDYFVQMLEAQWNARKDALRAIDEKRLAEPDWYRSNKLLGMMMYPANFGGTLKGVQEKLPYLTECGVNYLHLMPLLDSPKGKSDGGYAVSDFRKVRPDLGTMEDLAELADACHEKGMVLCLDFVLNHTSEEHAWAKAAKAGDPVARNRYFFYDNWDIPKEFEKTVPQVFPTTAPGNFTQLPDGQIVMTSFYPFQWDLNYANPMVFNDMVENLLFLANQGMDVIRLDAVPYIWKELGTDCRNLPKVHTLVRMMRLAVQIVCPSVLLLGEVVMEPKKVAPYFGTVEKPECDMLYNVTTMCTTWHTVATRDARLLKRQILYQQLRQLLYRFLVCPLCAAGCGAFKHRRQILPCGTVPHGQHTVAVHAGCHVPLYQNLRTVIQFVMCPPDSTTPEAVPEHCTVHAIGIPAQILASVLVDIRIEILAEFLVTLMENGIIDRNDAPIFAGCGEIIFRRLFCAAGFLHERCNGFLPGIPCLVVKPRNTPDGFVLVQIFEGAGFLIAAAVQNGVADIIVGVGQKVCTPVGIVSRTAIHNRRYAVQLVIQQTNRVVSVQPLPVEEAVNPSVQNLLNVMEIKADIQKIVLPVCHDDVLIDILHNQRLRRYLKGVFRLKPGHVLFQTLETIFDGVPFR